MEKALVIIPTYNEIENVANIIAAALEQDPIIDVLIVDDNSPDGTAEVVKNIQKEEPRVHMIQREGKLGLGTAYIAGFKYGINEGYDFIFEMDADFSHDPKDLTRLLHVCREKGADVAVGSRYVRGGDIRNWTWDRILMSYGASIYVRTLSWMPVKDPTAGFICYKREVLEKLDLDKIQLVGYAFQIEMKFAVYQNAFRIVEVPITFIDRQLGTSKMNTSIFKEAIIGVLKMRWRGWTGYYN